MDGINDSILNTIKKMLGVSNDYKVFDTDIIVNINSVFSTLIQLGVGPKEGFFISDSLSTWSDFLITEEEQNKFNFVIQYMYLQVKLVFDPPTSSFVLDAYSNRVKELEWRLNVMEETFRSGGDNDE